MHSTLIVPCAGRSSRFPNNRPKWSLTHPNGNLMLTESLLGLELNKYKEIIFIFISSDLSKNNLKNGIKEAIKKLNVKYRLVILNKRTKSQSETVAKAIKKLKIKGSILIKDSDGFFEGKASKDDVVYVSTLNEVGRIHASNKSFVDPDTNGFLKTIVEKEVISNYFCCGGYGFSDASDFLKTFNKLTKNISLKGELYISHIIYQQILDGKRFKIKKTSNYKDWGTAEEWQKYTSLYKTIFIDLDGVLVENSGEFVGKLWGTTKSLQNNVEFLNKLYNSNKVKIIITTSRKKSFKKQTINQLKKYNIKYHEIIFDLMHAQRILINDFATSNPFPSAKEVNLPRNSDNLKDYLSENFEK